MLRFLAGLVRYRRDRRGAAATEFAILLTLLVVPLLNAVDLGVYAYDYMEVRDAAQVAAQAVWATCAPTDLVPASISCSGYQTAANTTGQGTLLGTNAVISYGGSPCTANSCSFNFFASSTTISSMIASKTPGEGFACDESGVLKSTKDQPTGYDEVQATADEGNSCTGTAHDYVLIEVTDPTYAPIFPQVSVASLLSEPTTMVLMRLD